MSDFAALLGLPAPQAIDPQTYEDVLAAKIADLSIRDPDLAAYLQLESEPLRKSLEENAYREVLLRALINDTHRQTYYVYATGSNLDLRAAFYDVTRNVGETDEQLRTRIQAEIMGRSTGGTAERYRAKALGASIEVRDAFVWVDGISPMVRVAVFSTAVGGVASPALLEIVSLALNAPSVRMINDTISVTSAVTVVQNIAADIWLLPTTPMSVFDGLAATLQAAWTAEAGLGFDFTRSWAGARLMQAGVQRVEITTPQADVSASPHEAIALGTITLTMRGRTQ